jgi:ribose 5-phosphate isomerase B
MNVLCLGARVIGVALAEDLVTSFLGASLESEPRFQRRLDKVAAIENEQMSHGGHN